MPDKTRFDYIVSPDTVYITVDKDNSSIAKLDIGVSNHTDSDIDCDWLGFTISIGEGAGALTSDAGSISVSPSRPDEWSFVRVEGAPGQFRAEPQWPHTGLKAGGSISFQLSNIIVNGMLGATKIDIIEVTDDRREDGKLVNKIKSDLKIEYFTITPTSIRPGQSAILKWKTQAAARCALTRAGSEPENVEVTGSRAVSPTDSTSYTLDAFGGIGQVQATAHLSVIRVRIIDFQGPTVRIPPGGQARLTWRTEFAVRCELKADGETIDDNAPLQAQGQTPYKVTPTKNVTIYTLFAYSSDSSYAQDEVTVFLQPKFRLSLRDTWKTGLPSRMVYITTPTLPRNDTRIFVSAASNSEPTNQFYVLDTSSRKVLFSRGRAGSSYYQLELSLDSKKLLAETMLSITLFDATPGSGYRQLAQRSGEAKFIPVATAFHPNGSKVYVSSSNPGPSEDESLESGESDAGAQPIKRGVNVFSANDLSFLESIPAEIMPGATAISPDGTMLCFIEMRSAILFLVDLASKEVSKITIGADSGRYRIVNAVWSRDGKKVYATNCTPGTVWVVTAANKEVKKINLGADVTPAILRLGPQVPDFEEGSDILYALCGPDGTVAGISTIKDEVVSRFSLQQQSNPAFAFWLDFQKLGDWPVMAVAPDGKSVYVSNPADNSIFIIDNGWPKATKALRAKDAASQETVLDYIVSPTTVYTTRDPMNPSIVRLDIGVSNNTGSDVECDWTSFILSRALTSDFNSISASSSRPDEWEIAPIQGAPGQFRASPIAPNTGLKAGGSVSFQLANIIVDEEVGPARFEIVEMVEEPREEAIGINKIRADLNIEYFRVQPAVIKSGGTATLSWKTVAAARCILSWPTGSKEVCVTGSKDMQPLETTIYTLTAQGGLGPDVSDQKAVVVNRVIINFSATPIAVGLDGTTVLSWQILNSDPDTCIFNPGELKVDPVGNKIVKLKETSIYSLSARGGASSELKQLTVKVERPLIRHFGATTPEKFGDPVTLSWDVLYATSISIDQGVGQVLPIGTTVVKNPDQTTYTLTCLGLGDPVIAKVTVPGRRVRILYLNPTCIDDSYSCNNRFFGVRCACIWETELATSTQLIRVKDNKVVATQSGHFTYGSWAPAAGPEEEYKLVADGPGGPDVRFVRLGWWPTM